ncbi:GerAB/ArcD/ProY family transporter [Paenibacillus albus]|nr:GerAB/ArcD/ProY family transporter [Paenibacillus albus]
MLLSKGIMSISNLAPIFLSLLLLLILTVPNELVAGFERSRLTTFWFESANHSFSGWMNIYFSFLGYEAALLLMPYTNKKSRLHLAFQIGNVVSTLFYTFVSFMALGFFSFEQLKQLSYPVLNMLSNIQFPFAQRLDDFIFNLTLLRALFITTTYMWMAAETFHRLRPNAKGQTGVYLFLLVIAIAVFFINPTDLDRTNKWLQQLGVVEIGVAMILPVLLLGMIAIAKVKERRKYA